MMDPTARLSEGGRRVKRMLGATAAISLLALASVASAGAADGKEQIHLTAKGQAAAQAAVLTTSDFGTSGGWTERTFKPNIADAQVGCEGFHRKVSDLVVTGAAETAFSPPGSLPLQFDSLAEVLQTPKMVALDWQRTTASPLLTDCLRQQFSGVFTGRGSSRSTRWPSRTSPSARRPGAPSSWRRPPASCTSCSTPCS